MAFSRKLSEAFGEIGIVGGERRLDLALRQCGVKFLLDRAVGDARRVVLDRQQRARVDPARHYIAGERRQNGGREQSWPDALTAHDRWVLWRESLRVPHAIAQTK